MFRPKAEPDKALNDDGFVDKKEPTYHCGCGFSTKSATTMDSHVKSAHPDG